MMGYSLVCSRFVSFIRYVSPKEEHFVLRCELVLRRELLGV